MKKFAIFTIIIISIFLISIYIGMKLKLPNEETEEKGEIVFETGEEEIQLNEIQQAVSEDEVTKEHYVLREVGKYVQVYSIDDNEKEELYLSTDIATEYLPETDQLSLKEGIHVYSKKELNEILQDFE